MHVTPDNRPLVLCVLDGWGHSENCEANAVCLAKTPVFDRLWAESPHSLIEASEHFVGLPDRQIGNSEVGHMNLGAGRIVFQDLPRIDQAVADGSLEENPRLQAFIEALRQSGGCAHLLGLFSPGGVHSHQNHMVALAQILADAGVAVRLHAFLDGRDTLPKSALRYLGKVRTDHPDLNFATLCGRFFAMDRDQRWDRVGKAYSLLVDGEAALRFEDPLAAIQAAYDRGESDEFLEPVAIGDFAGMADGDGLLMTNFRADRARQLLEALLDPEFSGFTRSRSPSFAAALGMVSYSKYLDRLIPAILPPLDLPNTLGEVLAKTGLRQLRVAETEKYAHVTFFFNGGREEVFEGEDRILVPSPKVATYDLQPEMSAQEVTDRLVEAIESGDYAFLLVNYANGDMVGHSGKLAAAIAAAETVDHCIGRLLEAIEAAGGAILITADHGNAEMMRDPKTGQAHTAHTMNPVPVILAGAKAEDRSLADGRLADIAPTLLELMGLAQPEAMTGRSLLRPTAARGEEAAE